MKTIRCIIVDDEAPARDLLAEYVAQTPGIELLGDYSSAPEALERLIEGDVELMFLDIQMPRLRGTDFLKSLRHPPITVFTTAYRQYAPDAFDLDAVDYLIKPFPYQRFLQAVGKAREIIDLRNKDETGTAPSQQHLIIKSDGKLVKVAFSEIRYIEGWKEYVRIYTQDSRYVTLESLKNLERTLPEKDFMRIHKSYIVAIGQVRSIQGNQVELHGQSLPIGRSLKEEVVRKWTGN
jgi:DNA-binding LytR/AlgR family response regulator